MKMVLHLILWATCSATTLMFFGQFKCPKSILPTRYSYDCDRDSLNDSPFIDCFYSQLQNLVAANCFILLTSLASIVYSFGWFYLQPIKNLKETVKFCLNTHLSSKHFLFDGFSVARANDLDFLLQLLDHVDSGLAVVVQDLHVRRHLKVHLNKQFEVYRLMSNLQLNGFLKGEGKCNFSVPVVLVLGEQVYTNESTIRPCGIACLYLLTFRPPSYSLYMQLRILCS